MAARKKSLVANLALVAVGLAVAVVGAELLLRVGIALGVEAVRDPRLYAGFCDDDDHWKLHYRWREAGRDVWDGLLAFDPDLGWTMSDAEPDPCDGCERPVLLYGDSFVNGVAPTPRNQRLPKLLGRFLKDRPVVGFAVNGYGVDQILLRFRATHAAYTEPTIVFGMMTLNLDRSILTVRDAPKPFFALTEGGLEVRGVPLPPDTAAWHRDHPPEIRSYLLAALRRRLQLAGETYETEIEYRRAEKTAINAAILEALARDVEAAGLPLVVVVLYPPWELAIEGWRERFLAEHLGRLGVPYIDTKPLMLAASDDPAAELYHPSPNFHPNAAGNRIVAKAIAKHLRRRKK